MLLLIFRRFLGWLWGNTSCYFSIVHNKAPVQEIAPFSFYLFSCNTDLKEWKTIVTLWRVGNIHIIYISLIIELKMSITWKAVAGFKNRRQVRTKNFLQGLIWYAWGLWQAFLSDFMEFWWKMFIKISKHSAIALWTKIDFLLVSD